MTKKCTCCKEIKDLNEFTKHPRYKFGVLYECRLCRRAKDRRRFPRRDKVKSSKWARARRAYIRTEMYKAYGANCYCCGESGAKFLTLEHLNNDGAFERRTSKRDNNDAVMRKLHSLGWPKGAYAVACFNCNLGRFHNQGVCPHKNVPA